MKIVTVSNEKIRKSEIMKKKLLCLFMSVFMLICGNCLVGCDFFDGLDDDDDEPPKIDNSIDLDEFTPTPDDPDYDYDDGDIYYTSSQTDLITEIYGKYTIDRPFTLDKDNDKKRIYHNIYFYEEDFFQVLYYKNINQLGKFYAILADPTDTQYVSIKKDQGGNPYQFDIVSPGIYDLVLDTETFAIDVVRIGDIVTPVYETIKSCELKIQVSQNNVTYKTMTLDTDTNEYYIETAIPRDAIIGFYSAETHSSHYKLGVGTALNNQIFYHNYPGYQSVNVSVGGTYRVYLNAKTYVFRLELTNPDTAEYYCQVEWNQNNILSPVSDETPYLFEYNMTTQEHNEEVPRFYPELGMAYDLTVLGDGEVVSGGDICTPGAYKLTVNLKQFTLTVEQA
ncbi:MAG: hypothetical protein IKC64_04205 [Clostridia bacterium]|nr:hypothetical protein [Clostridia bacterium]